MNMQAYRRVIITRMVLLAALALFAAGLGTYDAFFASDAIREHNVFTFQCGSTSALGVMALVCVMKYSQALRSDKILRQQYIKEHDERMQAIRAKAGMPLTLYFAVVMIAAGTVIGYWNELIFVTLVIAAVAQLLVAAAVKLIYTRIY